MLHKVLAVAAIAAWCMPGPCFAQQIPGALVSGSIPVLAPGVAPDPITLAPNLNIALGDAVGGNGAGATGFEPASSAVVVISGQPAFAFQGASGNDVLVCPPAPLPAGISCVFSTGASPQTAEPGAPSVVISSTNVLTSPFFLGLLRKVKFTEMNGPNQATTGARELHWYITNGQNGTGSVVAKGTSFLYLSYANQ